MNSNKIIKAIGVFLLMGGFLSVVFYFVNENKNKIDSASATEEKIIIEISKGNVEIGEIPFDMPELRFPEFPENYCNIRDYGAIGNGENKNSQAIAKAIDDCYQKGGGNVIFPEGKWLTGPIHFKSNINLYLDKGAEIVFTTNFDDYLPVVFSKFQGMEYYNFSPPIYARDCENIAITGRGKIIGNGEFWAKWARTPNSETERDRLFQMSQSNVPAEKRIFGQKDSGLRPSFIQFMNCKNILIEGVFIEDGPMWTVHPIYSENMIIKDIKMRTFSMNTDGIAIDSSKNILIEDSEFSTGDDSISIKSGLENEGLRVNRPSENIVIRKLRFAKGHGGVAIGSEISGGVRNVFIEKCFFNGTSSGFRIKSTKSRGGYIENIWVKNNKMNHVEENAIVFNMNYTSALNSKDVSRLTSLKNIQVENLEGDSAEEGVDIFGQRNGIMERILFKDIWLKQGKESELKYVKGIDFQNFSLSMQEGPLMFIDSSRDVNLINFQCENKDGYCLNITGKRTFNINVKNSGIDKSKIIVEDKAKNGVKF